MATIIKKQDYGRQSASNGWEELPEFIQNAKKTGNYTLLKDYLSQNMAVAIASTLEYSGRGLPREIRRRLKSDSGLPEISEYKVKITSYQNGKELELNVSLNVTPKGDIYKTKETIQNDTTLRVSAAVGGVVDLVNGILYASGNIPHNGDGTPVEFRPMLHPIKVHTPLEYRMN